MGTIIVGAVAVWLKKKLADYAMIIGAVVAVCVGAMTWDHSRVNKGVQKERVRVEKQGAKIAVKSQAARAAAEQVDTKKALERWYID